MLRLLTMLKSSSTTSPSATRTSIAHSIQKISRDFVLEPKLIAAIVLQESSARPGAFRFEPDFYRRYIDRKPAHVLGGPWPKDDRLVPVEKLLRSASYGLMQPMGQVAREFGFTGDFTEGHLFDVETNLFYGCKKFSHCMKVAHGDIREALLWYNGRGNPKYPDMVLARRDNGEASRLLNS